MRERMGDAPGNDLSSAKICISQMRLLTLLLDKYYSREKYRFSSSAQGLGGPDPSDIVTGGKCLHHSVPR